MLLFKIDYNDANQRLDKFLKKLLPNATRSLIYKLNRKDKVKIKNESLDLKFKKQDNEYKLNIWDEVKIFLNENEFKKLSEKKDNKDNIEIIKNKDFSLNKKNIVYEDWSLLIINKDSWINVHSWDHKTKESNLISQVQDYLWNKFDSLTFKPSLIHRLDRDTSWLILIAKKKDILIKLSKDFKEHKKIKKIYYAIVLWKMSRKNWTIKKNLLRIENANSENKVQVSEKWKTAITNYKVINENSIKSKSWEIFLTELEINIETWRMHQIRVHLSSIWNPIIWDKLYWDKKINVFLNNNYWLNRQALHSWKIWFFHYWREKYIELEAFIKEDLNNFIINIKK